MLFPTLNPTFESSYLVFFLLCLVLKTQFSQHTEPSLAFSATRTSFESGKEHVGAGGTSGTL